MAEGMEGTPRLLLILAVVFYLADVFVARAEPVFLSEV